MMLAFEIDMQIVKWVMHALGKPLGPIAPTPRPHARRAGRSGDPRAPLEPSAPPPPQRVATRAPTGGFGRPPPSGKLTNRQTGLSAGEGSVTRLG